MSTKESELVNWDEEIYKQIPLASVAFRHARNLQVPEEAFEAIRFARLEVKKIGWIGLQVSRIGPYF